jgi:flagellar motility protein MotE (MotC chaperone)
VARAGAGTNAAKPLESDRKTAAQKDAQIGQLKSQLKQLQADAAAKPAPGASASPAAVSDEVKRVAEYWAGMDADKAAAIIKLLPDSYVKAVFSQMPADAVADIVSELPPKTAARLLESAAGLP